MALVIKRGQEVNSLRVFDGGVVREPVAHEDAVRVADMVRVPEGDFDDVGVFWGVDLI